jgi:hypothetical protein
MREQSLILKILHPWIWGLLCASAMSAGSACSSSGGPSEYAAGEENPDNRFCLLPQCDRNVRRVEPLPAPVCPATEPTQATECAVEGLRCSYGDSLVSHCWRFHTCTNQSWVMQATDPNGCESPPDGYCPESALQGQQCATAPAIARLACRYPGGVQCYCGERTGGGATWGCYGPPNNPACPEILPNLGEGCGKLGQFCNYVEAEDCSLVYSGVRCYQGAWEAAEGTCLL